VDFHPSGSALYAAGGSKVARFELGATTGAFLDLSTLYVSATVINDTSKKIKFLSPSLSGALSSARIIIGGVEVSSCDFIGRTEEVLSRLGSMDERRADFEAGFGLKPASKEDVHGVFETKELDAGERRNVTWRPKSLGILYCKSYLPVSLLSSPLILELTFLDDLKAGLDTTSTLGDSFSVTEMICHVDSLSCDPNFLTSISQHILSGNSLNMTYQNTQTSYYAMLSPSTQVAHARSASRLNSVMLSLGKADVANGPDKAQVELLFPKDNNMKSRITIGEKRFPATQDLRGAAMTYRKLIGLVGNGLQDGGGSCSITRSGFEKNSFLIPFGLEAASGVSEHSGISTANSPLNIFIEDAYNPTESVGLPNALYVHTNSDALLQLSKLGATLSM